MARNSEIMDMAVELAAELHKVGAMDKATLRKIEALAVPEVKRYSPVEIQAIRERNNVSQPVFAVYLNVARSTVAQWEQGKKSPSGPAARLLDLVARKGLRAIA
jgi:putative transcriptional regulator